MAACVRLWVAADHFLLTKLQKEALAMLERFCEHQLPAIMEGKHLLDSSDAEKLVVEMKMAVQAAYETYPHAGPCQRMLLDFTHTIRLQFLSRPLFCNSGIFDISAKFTRDLFMTTLQGHESKWVGQSAPDYRAWYEHFSDRCDRCHFVLFVKNTVYQNPQATKGRVPLRDIRWRCGDCVKAVGYPWQTGASQEAQSRR